MLTSAAEKIIINVLIGIAGVSFIASELDRNFPLSKNILSEIGMISFGFGMLIKVHYLWRTKEPLNFRGITYCYEEYQKSYVRGLILCAVFGFIALAMGLEKLACG